MTFVSEDVPSKLVSEHTLPDDIKGMFIEVNLRRKKMANSWDIPSSKPT